MDQHTTCWCQREGWTTKYLHEHASCIENHHFHCSSLSPKTNKPSKQYHCLPGFPGIRRHPPKLCTLCANQPFLQTSTLIVWLRCGYIWIMPAAKPQSKLQIAPHLILYPYSWIFTPVFTTCMQVKWQVQWMYVRFTSYNKPVQKKGGNSTFSRYIENVGTSTQIVQRFFSSEFCCLAFRSG